MRVKYDVWFYLSSYMLEKFEYGLDNVWLEIVILCFGKIFDNLGFVRTHFDS